MDFSKTWIFSTDFRKNSNIKFYQNPSGGSRVVPYGETDGRTEGQTDITKLILAFRNFSKVPDERICVHWRKILSILCTLSLRSSLNASDQVSHPYNTTGKILTVFFNLNIFGQQTERQNILEWIVPSIPRSAINLPHLAPRLKKE
jgi:hypothetical protein